MLLHHLKSRPRLGILYFTSETVANSLGLKKLLNVVQCHCCTYRRTELESDTQHNIRPFVFVVTAD